jgi:HEAT repeat protein
LQPAEQRKKGGEDQWEYRMYHSRRWGHSLKEAGGSNSKAVKRLTATLKDARAQSEIALRRTAVEALIPAAAVGNRGALAAQAKALGDDDRVVRQAALKSLQKAAGGKRLESGGAVSVALAEELPQFTKSLRTDVRRAAASALAHLTPLQDKELAKLAREWTQDEDGGVRAAAIEALGLAGSGSKALNALKFGLTDFDWRVSQAACKALTKVEVTKAQRHAARSVDSRGGEDDSAPGSAPSTARSVDTDMSESQAGSRPGTPAQYHPGSHNNLAGVAAMASSHTPADALAECCRSNLLRGLPRVEGVRALGKVAEPGDKSAILVAAHQLTDADLQVRRAAVSTLKSLAPGDRVGAIRASVSQLTAYDYRCRESAAEALAACTGKASNDTAFSLVASTLEGQDWGGRRGAANALRRLGELNDGAARDQVFGVLIPRLEHPDWSIRRKAAQALGVVAKGIGDVRAIKLLAGLARDPEEEVRKAVVEALPGAAPPKKCKDAIMMASTFCKDPNPRIREAACNALEELASAERSRSRVAIHAVSGCIQDDVEAVRLTAERVMRSIAPGRRTAIDDVAERLADPDEGTRRAAVAAFEGVGAANRERALKRVVPLLRHPDAGVRQAASDAMQGMMGPEEAACVAAAAHTVGRFRRRFQGPAGWAEMESEEEEEDSQEAGSQPSVEPTETQKMHEAAEAGVLEALMEGDLRRAAVLDVTERERLVEEEENQIKEDTDTESELSMSGTELDTDEEQEGSGDEEEEEGSRVGTETSSNAASRRTSKTSSRR